MSDTKDAEAAKRITAERLAKHLEPLLQRYDVKNRNHGIIYVDHQLDNIDIALRIIAELSVHFGVSTEVIRYKLIDFKLLNDVRSSLPNPNEVVRVNVKARFWAAYEDDREMNDKYDED